MAKLSAHGKEIGRFFSFRLGMLVAYMEDGTVLCKSPGGTWTVYGRKKAEVPLGEWIEKKREYLGKLPSWQRVKGLPSMRQLEEWTFDSVCESLLGETVEPDGYSSDGAPSWLLALGLI